MQSQALVRPAERVGVGGGRLHRRYAGRAGARLLQPASIVHDPDAESVPMPSDPDQSIGRRGELPYQSLHLLWRSSVSIGVLICCATCEVGSVCRPYSDMLHGLFREGRRPVGRVPGGNSRRYFPGAEVRYRHKVRRSGSLSCASGPG